MSRLARHVLPVLVLLTGAVGCSGDDAGSATAPAAASAASGTAPAPGPPSGASSPLTVTTPPATSAGSPPPVGGEGSGVVLGGVELGVTRLGAPFDQAVRDISTVLGTPTQDPKQTVTCIEADREVAWGSFLVAEQDGQLAGWASQSRTLQTPSGVTVGTDVATLRRVYGSSYEAFAANPDSGPTFAVAGTDVLGALSSAGSDALVTALFSSFCGGP